MPFTPFHLGPGALFKAVGGSRFSFMVFGGTQVLMDVEPLVRLMRQETVIHGVSHTIAGALVIGAVAGLVGRPVSEFVLRLLRIPHAPLTWTISFVSAFIGSYSHIFFDAVMHRDMSPFWPFIVENGLMGVISIGWLHILCLVTAVFGVAVILTKRQSPPT